MCLYKNHKFPYITIFPKTVYKVLRPIDGINTFETPHRGFTIKLGETYKGIFLGNNNIFKTIKLHFIGDGFIHSYNTISEAGINKTFSQVIIKCKIPSFTLYYKDGYCIASRKLKYIEVCQN